MRPSTADFLKLYACIRCQKLPMNDQIFSCSKKKHTICGTCLATHKTCPTCNVVIGSSRNVWAELFFSENVATCRHSGCKKADWKNEIVKHESNECVMRQVRCPFSKCNSQTGITSVMVHIHSEHSGQICSGDNFAIFTKLVLNKKSLAGTYDMKPIHLLEVDGQDFLLRVRRTTERDPNGEWVFWTAFVGAESDSEGFTSMLTLGNPDHYCVRFEARPILIDKMSLEEVLDGGIALVMSDKNLIKLAQRMEVEMKWVIVRRF